VPAPTPAQPQREDAAEDSREPIAPPALRVTVQEAARILETGADALLEAKYEVIADLRDGGGSIKEQHHCKCRSQEADVRWQLRAYYPDKEGPGLSSILTLLVALIHPSDPWPLPGNPKAM